MEANPSRLPSIRQFTLKDTKNRRRSENPNIALEEEEDSDDSEGSVDMLLFDLPCSVLRNDGAIKKLVFIQVVSSITQSLLKFFLLFLFLLFFSWGGLL